MKMVYITNIPSPYQIRWAEHLRKRHEVEFWFMTDIENSASGRPGYWNIERPEYCRILPSKFKKGELCYGPTLTTELDKFNPDVVMLGAGWFMITWMQGYRWAVKNKKRILAGPIEFSQNMYKFSKIIRNIIIYRIIYRKIDVWLANAYIHYDYLEMILKTKNNVLFMNFDDYSSYMEHPLRSDKDTITFMYGGAISRRLRVPELLRVFEKLSMKYNNIKLVIGGYGPEKENCRQIVSSSLSLADKVSFYDVKTWDEIPNVYKMCDVLVNYASYSPGSGVILSAVASGMGIISTITVNAVRHFVVDKYNGFIVNDENSLYLAMEKYVLQPKLIEHHSKRSRDIATSNLTFDKHLEDFDAILNTHIFPKI